MYYNEFISLNFYLLFNKQKTIQHRVLLASLSASPLTSHELVGQKSSLLVCSLSLRGRLTSLAHGGQKIQQSISKDPCA